MIEPHFHKGLDSPRLSVRDLLGGSIYTEDWALSSANASQSVLQHGNYTLAANTAFITFPVAYVSSFNGQNNLSVLITSRTANQQYVESVAKVSAQGLSSVSAVSGFTVSGSGTDSGFWMSIGYK